MKKTAFLLLVFAAGVVAAQQQPSDQAPTQPPASMQQSVQEPLPPPPPQAQVRATNLEERINAPTEAEVDCSGFISSAALGEAGTVRGGWDTPHTVRYDAPQYVYIKGSGFQEGARYFLVRKLRDINRWEAFAGQHAAVAAAGQPYQDIGMVQVIQGGVRGDYAIGQVIRSCDVTVPGDYAVPYSQRPDPEFRYTGDFDPFAPADGKLTGRIIMARDYDQFVGTGSLVYLSVGSDQGVKPGDYFRITRTYESLAEDEADRISYKASTTEDTQANKVPMNRASAAELPRRSLGQLMVVNVHPKSATALITFSLEGIKVGDGIEAFEPPPPPPPPPAPASTMPTISCIATPDTVHKGESSTITCDAASPDNHPITIAFNTSAGGVTPHDNSAVLDTAQIAAPATATVTGTVTDDRNQSASSDASVNVQPAPPAPPASAQQIAFKPGSSYVDNRAKAILDGVALQLQQQADATAVVIGRSDKGEGKGLAQRRADNVKKYLVSKGIDGKRIDARTSATPGKMAEVWVVPAGGTLPADAGQAAAPASAPMPMHHHAKKKAAAAPAAAPHH